MIKIQYQGNSPYYNIPQILEDTKKFFEDNGLEIEFTENNDSELQIEFREYFYRFCEAVKRQEGYYVGSLTYKLRNPGALRDSYLKDGMQNGFAYFNTYEKGWRALIEDVSYKMTKSSRLGPNATIYDFFKIYAPAADNNNPRAYAQFVAGFLGLTIDTTLGEIYYASGSAELAQNQLLPVDRWNGFIRLGKLKNDTFLDITAHEILHLLWAKAGLGDIHSKNWGQKDNKEALEYYLKNKTNMKTTKEQIAELYNLIFHRAPDEEAYKYIGYELDFVLEELKKSEEWKNWDDVHFSIKKLNE